MEIANGDSTQGDFVSKCFLGYLVTQFQLHTRTMSWPILRY